MIRALLGLLLGAGLAAAAGPAAGAVAPALTVFAAADLALAFREIVPRFEAAQGAKVALVLGSTGNLARQIEHGAPADVFFAADRTFVERLRGQDLVLPETVTLYARGRIVLARAKGSGPRLAALGDLLEAGVRHVAIANPLHAPYGRAAEQALRSAGVWEAVRPRLVYAENVRQALQYLEAGAAEAAIVAVSIASVPGVEWTPIDASLHAPLDQVAAVVRRSPRPALAQAFIGFVVGREGREVMKRYGFLLPGEF